MVAGALLTLLLLSTVLFTAAVTGVAATGAGGPFLLSKTSKNGFKCSTVVTSVFMLTPAILMSTSIAWLL